VDNAADKAGDNAGDEAGDEAGNKTVKRKNDAHRRPPVRGVRLAAVLVTAVAVASACGSNNKVGNQALLNIKQQAQGGFDTTTTTTVAGTLPAAVGVTTTAPHAATTAPRTHATTPTTSAAAVAAATVSISINPDSNQSQFTPSAQPAYPGTPVRWTNKDTVSRSVVSDDGTTFNSGPLAPGASYTWTAWSQLGRINYHDGTRPYAVATLDVIQRP
jgi:plastocyanin